MGNQKYRDILEKIQDDIDTGKYKPGQRLPSEAELGIHPGNYTVDVWGVEQGS